ncbi:MAG TPA: SRPBCC family protein [Thiobacillaceae bacterium]|nr:SRPBCC family protein [Thiobacillaceae bacterium]
MGRVGLALLWLHSCLAWAQAEVQVEGDANVIRISAQIATEVDRKTAWSVLSDYQHWADFVPDLLVSRVISRPGEPLLVEQRGRIPWLPSFPLVVVAAVEETPYKRLRFQRIAGNIKALEGEWQIQGKVHVRLIYHSTVEPGFPMPPQMTMEIFRQDAKVRLEAMAQEMARRAAADR